MKSGLLTLAVVFAFASPGLCQPRPEVRQQQAAPLQSPRIRVTVPEGARAKFDELGFVAVPSYNTRQPLASLYNGWKHGHDPVVVTTDLALHSGHLLFDWSLRFLEIAYLRGDLIGLSDTLIAQSMDQYYSATDSAVKDAALANACYLVVGKRLLTGADGDGLPEPWKAKIETELENINDAAGMSQSPLFGYLEDYTQYKPRGHYARTEEFKGYFRAMMWFGRMKLRLNTREEVADAANARRAMLLCDALAKSKVRGETALAVWQRIYETTAFFAGQSDDLAVNECAQATAHYSKPLNPADADSARQFIEMCSRLPRPRILGAPAASAITTSAQPWPEGTLGLTLFGQRYSLDAYVMQQLTFDSVLEFQSPKTDPLPFTCVNANGMFIRAFPRGLDVMSVLGFPRAQALLVDGKDDRYKRYPETLAKLKDMMTGLVSSRTPEDLYTWRLRASAALAVKPSGKLPRAFESPAWADKELTTALGSWSELRRDIILYAKQSYSMSQSALAGMGKGGPIPLPPPAPRGYVEPMPEVYSTIRQSVDALCGRLNALAYPEDKTLMGYLTRFSSNLMTLELISKKELAGESLSDGEFSFIENIGGSFAMPAEGYPHSRDVEEKFMSKADNYVPVIADVHTDVNSHQVLEEALGAPLTVYMLCPVDGADTVCIGASYSQYEFKQPMQNRLTDDEWRKMLDEGKTPALSPWMASYVAVRPQQ